MKKMMNVWIIFMLLSSIIPLAYADNPIYSTDPVEFDEQTQQELELMNSSLGAQIRFLQLEKAVVKNIEKGQFIISSLQDSNVNCTSLQIILMEFDFVKQEIGSALDNDTLSVTIFIDLKHDAINLSKEFKDTIKELINTSLILHLRQSIQNFNCNATQNLSKNINERIRQYNKNQFSQMYQLFGENNSIYINEYLNDNLSMNQIKQDIYQKLNRSGNESFGILKTLKQNKIKNKIHAQESYRNASKEFQQRQKNRLQMRLNQTKNLSNNQFQKQLINRFQRKINNQADENDSGNQDDQPNNQQGQGNSGNDSSNGSGSSGSNNSNSNNDTNDQNNSGNGSNKFGKGDN